MYQHIFSKIFNLVFEKLFKTIYLIIRGPSNDKFINILFVLILYMLVAAEKRFKMLQKLKYYVWMGGWGFTPAQKNASFRHRFNPLLANCNIVFTFQGTVWDRSRGPRQNQDTHHLPRQVIILFNYKLFYIRIRNTDQCQTYLK